jgi:hypothetical protein
MKSMKRFQIIILIFLVVTLLAGCRKGTEGKLPELNREPVLEPDYSGVTIPVNIAPLNFIIKWPSF